MRCGRGAAEAARRSARAARAVLGVLAFAAVVEAEVSSDVRTLTWRRPVLPVGGAGPGWYAILEDSVLAAASGPDFADLRLVDGEGRSRPLHAEAPARSRVRFTVLRELPVAWAEAGEGTREMLVELPAPVPARLSVEITGLSASMPFQVTGRDSAAGSWVFLAVDPDMPAIDAPAVSARVDLGETRRFLRLQQDGGPAPGSEDRVRLLSRETAGPALFPVPTNPVAGRFRGAGNDEWQADIVVAGPIRALARLDVRWAEGQAGRPMRLAARLERGGWRDVHVESRPPREGGDASFEFEPVRTTALRLSVFGAGAPNAPCAVQALHAVPQRWLFRSEATESLWVAYGDPHQEVASGFAEGPGAEEPVHVARLGSPEASPWFREPGFGLPWLRRRPQALGAAMIVLLLAVAWMALGRRGRPEERT
jgi:hypothetical protein